MEEIISVTHIEPCKHLFHYVPNFGFRVWFGSLLHVVKQLKKSTVVTHEPLSTYKFWFTLTVPSFINSNTKFNCCFSRTSSFSCTMFGCCFNFRSDDSALSFIHSSQFANKRLILFTATNSPVCLFCILYTSPKAPVPIHPRLVYRFILATASRYPIQLTALVHSAVIYGQSNQLKKKSNDKQAASKQQTSRHTHASKKEGQGKQAKQAKGS